MQKYPFFSLWSSWDLFILCIVQRLLFTFLGIFEAFPFLNLPPKFCAPSIKKSAQQQKNQNKRRETQKSDLTENSNSSPKM